MIMTTRTRAARPLLQFPAETNIGVGQSSSAVDTAAGFAERFFLGVGFEH
jgi:hypothetical protein